MKKITLFLLCLCLGVGICDAKKKSRVEDVTTTREITLDESYTGLIVSSMIDVVLEVDRNPEQIKIVAVGIPVERVDASVRGEVLKLSCDTRNYQGKKNNSPRVTVYVGVGELDSFVCTAASSVRSATAIDRPEVTIEAMGASEIRFDVKCQILRMHLSGAASFAGNTNSSENVVIDAMGASDLVGDIACQELSLAISGAASYKGKVVCVGKAGISLFGASDCSVSGTTQDLLLKVEGASGFRGKNFIVSGLADCFVTGASDASIHCTGELAFDVSKSSNFSCAGNPRLISVSVGNTTIRNR